jgi:ADYC domain
MSWIDGVRWSVLFASLGCAEPGAVAARIAPGECPELGCGLNGAWLGVELPFRELDLGTANDPGTRRPNERGLTIESFRDRSGNALAIDVVGDELLGRSGAGAISGPALEGSIITLVTAKVPVARYFLRIERVAQTGFWTEPCIASKCAPSDRLPLYTITFTKQGDPKKPANLCEPLDPVDPTTAERGIDATVLVFRGDRYTRDYTVSEPAGTSWFNIACAGTAISKLHLLRHTRASSRLARNTSVAQRQAVLRMLTADYCGVGHPFTTDGHPLHYTFRQSWEPQYPRFATRALSSVDALWTDDGARCIGTPRLADEAPVQELLRDIGAVCGDRVIPRCNYPIPAVADVDAILDATGSYAISGNPSADE